MCLPASPSAVRPFAHSPIRPFAYSPIRPFAHSPIRPFAHSLACSSAFLTLPSCAAVTARKRPVFRSFFDSGKARQTVR